ncbi:MAG: hypothetical protein PWP23_707 [Candidatus Sumerlaeota bacterium]|nr:hypothetical protein [Candidatus Sumerlaeota bacterium]
MAKDERIPESQRAVGLQRSFVGPAVVCFFLYWLCWLPGFVANVAWLIDSRRVKRASGVNPTGSFLLWVLFLFGLGSGAAIVAVALLIVGGPAAYLAVDRTVMNGPQEPVAGEVQPFGDALTTPTLSPTPKWTPPPSVRPKFKVEDAELIPAESAFRGNTIRFTITNGTTDLAVAQIDFELVYQTPGRAVPWGVESVRYDIPGGLEPGETATWTLSLGSQSEIGAASIRDGAVLTVKPMRFVDASGEPHI